MRICMLKNHHRAAHFCKVILIIKRVQFLRRHSVAMNIINCCNLFRQKYITGVVRSRKSSTFQTANGLQEVIRTLVSFCTMAV